MTNSNLTEAQIRSAVENNITIAGVLRELGLTTKGGGSYRSIHRYILKYNLDTSHWLGNKHLLGKKHNQNKCIPLDSILVKNSTYANIACLKRRLVKENVLEYKCSNCNITEWLGQRLSLHLDHINGIHNDHTKENLRFLCPNCHSLTDTFAGKNKGKGGEI